MSGPGGGIGGTVNGRLIGHAPGWVDLKRAPGTSAQPVTSWSSWLGGVVRLKHIFFSPNLIWLSIAAAVYVLAPYDLQAAKGGFAWGWVSRRIAVNFGVFLAYYGFWSGSLYVARRGQRKFAADKSPSLPTMAHNVWYACLGTLQWCGWEVVFMRLWASGRLPFIADADAFATPANALRMLLWTALVPLWRGLHFYLAHRLIHVRVLYKYVHSLHHRNVDIEPFSGLTMVRPSAAPRRPPRPSLPASAPPPPRPRG